MPVAARRVLRPPSFVFPACRCTHTQSQPGSRPLAGVDRVVLPCICARREGSGRLGTASAGSQALDLAHQAHRLRTDPRLGQRAAGRARVRPVVPAIVRCYSSQRGAWSASRMGVVVASTGAPSHH